MLEKWCANHRSGSKFHQFFMGYPENFTNRFKEALTKWPQFANIFKCYFFHLCKNAHMNGLEYSSLNKMYIFQCIGKRFCVEFQKMPLKFHTKYFTHTLKAILFCTTLKFYKILDLTAHMLFWEHNPVLSAKRDSLVSFSRFTNTNQILIPIWISDNIPYKVWDEITYPFPNLNSCTVEVW